MDPEILKSNCTHSKPVLGDGVVEMFDVEDYSKWIHNK